MAERFPDVLRRFRRGPQIIMLKDAALISAFAGISSGDVVVDAGAGSGFLAAYLGNLVKPDGRVISYERRVEFANLAERNIHTAGLSDVVTIKRKDVFEGIDERNVDAITLDLADAEKAVAHAREALREGGVLVSYLPNVEQVKRFVEACGQNGFVRIETYECMLREMLVRDVGTRPQTKGIMHTGYVTFARKPEGKRA
jgi:tRNA (adenine57-N1/adenine58-N1)-methyltransferase